jgi:glycosyltransferase involved in cell wall biosynthesis
MNEFPRVSVIVPHYNDLPNLDRCLTSLEAQTYGADRLEIVVSDNGSAVGINAVEAVVNGRAKVVVAVERGAGPARNAGVAASQGEILAFIDSDCRAEPQWIFEGVKALGENDFVGGEVTVLVDDWQGMTAVEAFERIFAFNFKDYIERKGFTGSGNLFCRRDMFDAVGGFRTGVSEDVEWSHRARSAGYRLAYAPRAVIGHPARRTWAELLQKWRRVNEEMFRLACEQPGGRLRWLVRTLAMPLSAAVHTPKVLTTRQLRTMRERRMALSVLYAIRFWRFRDGLGLLKRSWVKIKPT